MTYWADELRKPEAPCPGFITSSDYGQAVLIEAPKRRARREHRIVSVCVVAMLVAFVLIVVVG